MNTQANEAPSKKKKAGRGSLKTRKRIHNWVRFVIQLGFLVTFPSAFTAAFAGMKYILTQIGSNSLVELTSFIIILLGLCGYTIVFGRFFCGYACAFGSFGDWVHTAFEYGWKKVVKKKVPKLPIMLGQILNYVKYVILLGILYLCFKGTYGNYQGTSPWDVFSRLESLLPGLDLHAEKGIALAFGSWKSDLLSGYMIGGLLLLAIVIGMCLQERFFCRFLCPMGAVFSLLPVLPIFNLRRNRETCSERCNVCQNTCPAGIALPEHTEPEVLGECFQCQKCTVTCPKQNVQTGISKLSGNNLVFTLIKAALLAGLMYYLNI